MKIAKFVNATDEPFTGKWNGQEKTVAPGQELYMSAALAYHFAKHLANRELTKLGIHDQTSPRKPEDAPKFMAFFNKFVFEDEHSNDMDGLDIMDVQPQSKHIEEDPKLAAKRAGSMTVRGPEDPDLADADKQKADEEGFKK